MEIPQFDYLGWSRRYLYLLTCWDYLSNYSGAHQISVNSYIYFTRMGKPRYIIQRICGYWWDIKKDTKVVGYISIGSAPANSKHRFYAVHLDPLTPVGHGYQTVKDALKAYLEKFPIN